MGHIMQLTTFQEEEVKAVKSEPPDDKKTDATRTLILGWWGCTLEYTLEYTFLASISIEYACYDLGTPLLGIRQPEMYTYIHQNSCPRVLIAALFVIDINWTLLKCLSIAEWIHRLGCLHTVQY